MDKISVTEATIISFSDEKTILWYNYIKEVYPPSLHKRRILAIIEAKLHKTWVALAEGLDEKYS